jgi:predicted small lipoprotein YifL
MNRTLLTMVALVSLIACGEKKPAKDPNAESTETATETATETPTEESKTGTSSNSSSGGSSPIVNEKATRSQSSYDKENTDVMLVRAARQVKANCGASKDEDGKALGPWGKVSIKVMLGHNGHVKNVAVPAPCIVNAFSNLQFPPWAGSDTEVDWEVELVAPAKDKK